MLSTLDYSELYHAYFDENHNHDYIICAMFTEKYKYQANRLKYSCHDHNLPIVIYKIPEIHCSVSMSGTENVIFSKQYFILSCLEKYNIPILYLDADVVIVQQPDFFDKITTDFAIYNWLADIENTAYALDKNKAYKISHEIRFYSQEQLLCSGPVSYWKPTIACKTLLTNIISYLAYNTYVSDDHMIDIFFNFRDFDMTYTWLPKEYCRFPWWPQVKPIIIHPDFPTLTQDRPTNSIVRFDLSKCTYRTNLILNVNGQKLYEY